MKDREEKIYANALNQSVQIGAVGLKKIKAYFKTFKNGFFAPFKELENVLAKKDFKDFRKEINPETEFEKLEKESIKILLENDFPRLLKEIVPLPQILYAKGELKGNNESRHLAVVGTRKFSSYGREAAQKIVAGLKGYDFTVVSGMALGIDTFAHKTALDNGMPTIAVLGCGLKHEIIYPPQNRRLSQEIVEKGGCLLSEYPHGMKAGLYTFPQRNRIVAGLSHGTLVVEAPQKSGSLITAFLALEYNREVFAVPGEIFAENSRGVNYLLKMGAVPVTGSEDVLRAFGIEPENTANCALSPLEEKIITLLFEPIRRDELIRKIGLPIAESNPLLSQMEIRGIIKEMDGMMHKI